MSTERNNRGISRVLAKLEASVAGENYYEAHQMYRTLHFRYIAQKKYDECLDLLYNGALTFLNHDQQSSGIDLAILIIDTLEKSEKCDCDLWIQKIGEILAKTNPSAVERETFIARAVKWSANISKNSLGHPSMHKQIAQIMWSEGNIETARHHYLLSRDGASCGQMLVHLSRNKGYPSETDLFIAQIILQQLCLKEPNVATNTFETYTVYHPKIACPWPPFPTPLLNFIHFLLKAIEVQKPKLSLFKTLCDLYKTSLERDPAYEKYLQKIGVIYFSAQQPQQPAMGGLFGDLFSRLYGQTMGGNDDEEPETSRSTARNDANTELD